MICAACVSGMARLGVAPHVADKVLNHQTGTISGVAAVYQRHEFLAERKNALERWGAHIASQARRLSAGFASPSDWWRRSTISPEASARAFVNRTPNRHAVRLVAELPGRTLELQPSGACHHGDDSDDSRSARQPASIPNR